MSPVDTLLAQMSVGQTAALALELMDEELRKGQYQADMLAYQHCSAGTLTPELAMNFWFKKHALYVLHQGLKQKVRAGQSSAQKAAYFMEADPDAE